MTPENVGKALALALVGLLAIALLILAIGGLARLAEWVL